MEDTPIPCVRAEAVLLDLLPERNQCQKSHLEVLESERDADYRDAAEDAEPQMQERYLYSSKDNPDDVHDNRQTACIIRSGNNVVSERPECKPGNLQKLQSEWDSDYRDAEKYTDDGIVKTDQDASKQQPKYVSYKFHIKCLSMLRCHGLSCRA